ncbi:hypothetical protein MET9862_05417 [Methylobacterium symbioticum]|jgi:hypothetical protein|uniref:Uncharacterized protein n=1 Tax=Methylobacterium symbioticum TaxID=2584084 RepID=A0A509EM62_9HYPH|nr:hypothetical protein MET9862_05417 [Methylobacterium symbioticum]
MTGTPPSQPRASLRRPNAAEAFADSQHQNSNLKVSA